MVETYEQLPFGSVEFAENPEPRCPCILLLDISRSMTGRPIQQLNEGLTVFRRQLAEDSLAMKRVEVAVITFGPVKVETDFQSAANYPPRELKPNESRRSVQLSNARFLCCASGKPGTKQTASLTTALGSF